MVEEYKDDDIGWWVFPVESDMHVVSLAITMSTVRNTILMFK